MFRLTENRTVFEYDDGLGDNNILVYHPGYIRITEIDLYQQYANDEVEVNNRIISNLCNHLNETIHNGSYHWIIDGDYSTPQQSAIMTVIMGRLKCIYDDYNGYNGFANLHLRYDWDGEEYQSNLANYIVNKFISSIGYNQTITLFTRYFGDIIRYLFNQ